MDRFMDWLLDMAYHAMVNIVVALPIMLMWNAIDFLDAIQHLSYWNALGLLLLSNVFFKARK